MTTEEHLDIKVGKKQVLLCNTGRNFKDYMKGLTYRRNGKYKKIPNYIIDKEGKVYEMSIDDVTNLYLTGYHNDYEDGVVVISLENNGWLKRRSSDGKYVNWLGDIYSKKVFEKKWRNKLFWDEYTDKQMESTARLIEKICEENDLFLIEDAAHAHGSSIKGKKAGTLGLCGSFSFYPTKVLNTAEGGMITTDDKTIFEKSLIFREHGKKDHNFNIHTELGYNWRFSELHALLGLQQMKIVDDIISKRQKIAKLYDDQLNQTSGITLIEIPDHIECSYYKYIVYLDKRYDRHVFKNQLKKEFNISLPGEVYAEGCHNQPVFKKYPELVLNKTDEHFPGAKFVSDRQICLPLYPSLTDDELIYVVDSLKSVLESLN